jgi:anti-anti-sigma factor
VTSDLPTPGIQTSLTPREGGSLLRVEGEVDLLSAPELEAALAEGIQLGGTLVADLTEVSFIDSTGLRVLLEARDRAATGGGELRLAIAEGGAVQRLLTLSGVLDLFGRSEPGGSPA